MSSFVAWSVVVATAAASSSTLALTASIVPASSGSPAGWAPSSWIAARRSSNALSSLVASNVDRDLLDTGVERIQAADDIVDATLELGVVRAAARDLLDLRAEGREGFLVDDHHLL